MKRAQKLQTTERLHVFQRFSLLNIETYFFKKRLLRFTCDETISFFPPLKMKFFSRNRKLSSVA